MQSEVFLYLLSTEAKAANPLHVFFFPTSKADTWNEPPENPF